MIRRQLPRMLALLVVVGLAGCYSAPVMPPGGNIYSNVSAPLDTDADGLAPGSKMGEATSCSILGLVSWGDCSVDAAAQNGGLTTINNVDYNFWHILGIYQKFTTVAHGE